MQRTTLCLPLFLLLAPGCQGTEGDIFIGQDANGGVCYRGWSNDPTCCLSSDTTSPSGGSCATGYFTALECGRLDPVCESIDAGPSDSGPVDLGVSDTGIADGGPTDGGDALCYRGWSGGTGCCLTSDTQASSNGTCPSGYFLAAQCGRLDPVCESVDGGGPAVACDQFPPVFPEFDRSCTVAQDCAIGTRQFNCCGSMIVTGITSTAAPDFESAARLCASQFPGCGCAAEPTRADDGTTRDPTLNADAIVDCVDSVCQTTFPQSPQRCGPNLSCDPATEVCVATSPIGPSIQYACQPVPTGCSVDRSCACVQDSFCVAPFDTCVDVTRNEVSCECPQCQ